MPTLVLGTAQWGLDYGCTNALGRPGDYDIAHQVALARQHGVNTLDTAVAYGEAADRIRMHGNGLDVVTKVAGADAESVASEVNDALHALGRDRLAGVLLHDWDVLDRDAGQRAARVLEALRSSGTVEAFGVSAYDEASVAAALDTFERLDLVQVPASALDQRLNESEVLASVRSRGGRVQVRSAFLQGVLLAPEGHAWQAHRDVRAWFDHCAQQGIDPLDAALAHVRSLPWCDAVVVGVADAAQWQQVLEAWERGMPARAPYSLGSTDGRLVDPRTWSRL